MNRFPAHRPLAAWCIGCVWLVCSAACAAEPAPPESRSFFAKLNPFASGTPGPRVRGPVAPLSTEALLAVLQTEKDAYTRRLDSCHRLREIALDTGDEQLELQVNELEKKATDTYRTRVARLGVKSLGPTLPSAGSAEVLDRTLGAGVAVNPLSSKAKSANTNKTATAKASTNAFKEVLP